MKDLTLDIDKNIIFNYRVGVMIYKGNKVLLETAPDALCSVLPGGRVKALENTKIALKRELNEELHFDVDIERLKDAALIENFFEYEGNSVHEMYFVYRLKANDNELNDKFLVNYDSDNNYYKWVDNGEFENENILPVCIKKLFNNKEFMHIIQDN